MRSEINIADVRWDDKGLAPAIIQDIHTKAILMVAYMNKASLSQTIAMGQTVFWSRSRSELWHKGATSGNYHHMSAKSISIATPTQS